MTTTRIDTMINGNHLLSLVFVGAAAASAALDASITNSTTSTDDFELACSSFATQLSIDNVTDSFTEYIPARGNMSYNGVPAVCQSTQTASVDVCRVYLNVSTSYQSGIRFEAWFPREYNGRFLSTGNNGLSGCELDLLEPLNSLKCTDRSYRCQTQRCRLWYQVWFRYRWCQLRS